jgi:hypothetical protein
MMACVGVVAETPTFVIGPLRGRIVYVALTTLLLLYPTAVPRDFSIVPDTDTVIAPSVCP